VPVPTNNLKAFLSPFPSVPFNIPPGPWCILPTASLKVLVLVPAIHSRRPVWIGEADLAEFVDRDFPAASNLSPSLFESADFLARPVLAVETASPPRRSEVSPPSFGVNVVRPPSNNLRFFFLFSWAAAKALGVHCASSAYDAFTVRLIIYLAQDIFFSNLDRFFLDCN